MPHTACRVGTETASEPPAQTTVAVNPGAAPLVDGCESKAAGIDDKQSAFKRIGVMLPQWGQTIVMRATFAGRDTADILGKGTRCKLPGSRWYAKGTQKQS